MHYMKDINLIQYSLNNFHFQKVWFWALIGFNMKYPIVSIVCRMFQKTGNQICKFVFMIMKTDKTETTIFNKGKQISRF